MFALAIFIGIYSYGIFLLGLLGILYPSVIVFFSFILFFFAAAYFKGKIRIGEDIAEMRKEIEKNVFSRFLVFFLFAQGVINIIGALGPELGFDALWYHLTLPKLYLLYHSIVHFPGGVLYYSDMPKLTEMLYTAVLPFGGEIAAKLVHYLFGILTVVVLYRMGRMFLSVFYSFLACAIFYSNLVVGWESITAYIDLTRTFFELMALWGFLLWLRRKERKWLIESGVMLGLAITTKLLALGSLFVFCLLIFFLSRFVLKTSWGSSLKQTVLFVLSSLLIPLPWFVFSFVHTGNPIFPFFTPVYTTEFSSSLLQPIVFFRDNIQLFLRAADPISPLYFMLIPAVVYFFRSFSKEGKLLVVFSVLAIFMWYVTPRTGGGRFILPYLPLFSIVGAMTMEKLFYTFLRNRFALLALQGIVILTLLVSLVYRGVANGKYVPVIVGNEKKSEFLRTHLNFSFGDFYDTDGYFAETITDKDRVLLYGFHNLYYVDFPFIDASWVQRGDRFNYIAVQNGEIPERFRYFSLVYYNPETRVRLYTLDKQPWIY